MVDSECTSINRLFTFAKRDAHRKRSVPIDSYHIVSAHATNCLILHYLREITREGATFAYMHVYLVACTAACLSAGAGSLRSIYCLSLRLHASPFFMCARTQQCIQQWIRGVCEQRMP